MAQSRKSMIQSSCSAGITLKHHFDGHREHCRSHGSCSEMREPTATASGKVDRQSACARRDEIDGEPRLVNKGDLVGHNVHSPESRGCALSHQPATTPSTEVTNISSCSSISFVTIVHSNSVLVFVARLGIATLPIACVGRINLLEQPFLAMSRSAHDLRLHSPFVWPLFSLPNS